MSRRLPDLNIQNPDGACWTCVSNGDSCDASLPWCETCVQNRRQCAGYHARLAWPAALTSGTKQSQSSCSDESNLHRLSFATFGLPPEENLLLQHYMKNLSRIQLAVDHNDNGYRKICRAAVNDAGLLNAILALSASHLSRWQKKEISSAGYLRKSLQHLQQRFSKPSLAKSEVTLLTMLVLVTYEAFLGRSTWRYHFDGVLAWVRAQPNHSKIDPFVLSWMCMSGTQLVLHTTEPYTKDIFEWLDQTPSLNRSDTESVDPLYGCSVSLPKLMLEAAKLSEAAEKTPSNDYPGWKVLHHRAEALQEKILDTQMDPDILPRLSMTCLPSTGTSMIAVETVNTSALLQSARNAAEVFRHALHIFVFRSVNSPLYPPSPQIRASIDAAFELLPLIPDTVGPGSMLGWALVMIGSETDTMERREFIRSRCESLALLELNNGRLARKVLEEVWRRQDSARRGEIATDKSVDWKGAMRFLGIDIALF